MSGPHQITPIVSVDCDLVDSPWPFAQDRAAEIDAHWAKRTREKPDMFNGHVFVLRDGAIDGETFRGSFIEAEFKAFLMWRDLGFPTAGARSCFSMAAIETADGAFVLGEMAPHTAPSGQIYFPAGTPDREDVVAGKVDLDGSAERELREETGLGPDDVFFETGFLLVSDDRRICCMKPVRARDTADVLVARIHAWLAQESKPELARMHIVRAMADVVPAMPSFVVAHLAYKLAGR